MPDSSEGDSRMRHTLLAFAGSTSAHGIGKLASPLWYVQLLWLLLIGIALGVFSFHLSTMVTKYLDEPVSTSVTLRGTQFKYPYITLCNQKMLSVSTMATKSSLNATARWEWTPAALKFLRSLQAMLNVTGNLTNQYLSSTIPNPYPNSTTYLRMYEELKYDLAARIFRDSDGIDSFTKFTLQPVQQLVRCRFGPYACDNSNFIVSQMHDSPMCMTFNYKSLQNKHNLTDDEVNSYALQVYLYTDSNPVNADPLNERMKIALDPFLRMSSNGGVNVYIHSPGSYPTTVRPIGISNGYEATLLVDYQKFSFVSTRSRQCLASFPNSTVEYDFHNASSSSMETKSFDYTNVDCFVTALQKLVKTSCGCVSADFPLPSGWSSPLCSNLTDAFDRYNTNDNSTITDINSLVKNYQAGGSLTSSAESGMMWLMQRRTCEMRAVDSESINASAQCLNPCSFGRYETKIRLIEWPSKAAALLTEQLTQWLDSSVFYRNGYDSLNLTFVGETTRGLYDILTLANTKGASVATDNFLSLVVQPADLSGKSTVTSESSAYEIQDLFSDLGGILGLYLGVSVLTLCEVIELLLHVGFITFGCCCMKKDKKVSVVRPMTPMK